MTNGSDDGEGKFEGNRGGDRGNRRYGKRREEVVARSELGV